MLQAGGGKWGTDLFCAGYRAPCSRLIADSLSTFEPARRFSALTNPCRLYRPRLGVVPSFAKRMCGRTIRTATGHAKTGLRSYARPGERPPSDEWLASRAGGDYLLGWGVIRRYGRGAEYPFGYFCWMTASSCTDSGMITSSPSFQLPGVATV